MPLAGRGHSTEAKSEGKTEAKVEAKSGAESEAEGEAKGRGESEAEGEAKGRGETDSEGRSGNETRSVSQLAREAERGGGEKQLSRLQRGCLGGAGATLATAGLGGLAWLHWPLLSPSGACALAGCCGTALLALAARGDLPKPRDRGGSKPKPLLELKALNDDLRLKTELEALRKLEGARHWPKDVQAALAGADKVAAATAKTQRERQQKELLEEVRQGLAAGATGDALRRRLRPRLFVFDFAPGGGSGLDAARPQSTKAQIEVLRTQVSFILSAASEYDEALVRISSPGGAVAPYGLAASQLQRLRDAGLRLTVCVDTVAASGGYMMACVADRIVAAPFAMLGSIGVLAGVPNIHKVLDRNDIDFVQVTGGKYKRTVNVLTPNTEEGLAKFRKDVDDIHAAFREHVKKCRPALDVEQVATGEVWLGSAALEKGLVDSLGTSDEEIRSKVAAGFDAVEVTQAKKKREGLAKLFEGVGGGGAELLEAAASRLSEGVGALWRRAMSGAGVGAGVRLEAPEHSHRF